MQGPAFPRNARLYTGSRGMNFGPSNLTMLARIGNFTDFSLVCFAEI